MYAGSLLVVGANDMATAHHELAAQRAVDLSEGLAPSDVTAISNCCVWWRCEGGYTW